MTLTDLVRTSAIGFDEMFDRLNRFESSLVKCTYPPYNIKKLDENRYLLEMAVAGFAKSEIEIELKDGTLTIKGNMNSDDSDYLFKGIATRNFTRQFSLADNIEVKSADMLNGMLRVVLERFVRPEDMPKKIAIEDGEAV